MHDPCQLISLPLTPPKLPCPWGTLLPPPTVGPDPPVKAVVSAAFTHSFLPGGRSVDTGSVLTPQDQAQLLLRPGLCSPDCPLG